MSILNEDDFRDKGAVEKDRPEQDTNTSMPGQIGHRHKDELIDTRDTDFPEPGQNPEHTGEPEQNDSNGDNPTPDRSETQPSSSRPGPQRSS